MFPRRRLIPSSMPFRPARTTREAILMQDALEQAVGVGDDNLARNIAAAIRASDVDANSVGVMRALRALEREPMEVLPQRAFEDMAQEIGASVRSYDGLRSGRTGNLNNQWRGDIAGRDIRRAAEEGIQSAREARAAEQMGRAVATAGAGGLAAMIADSMDRMTPSAPGIRGVQSEAVDMEPMADMGMPEMTASIEDPIRAAAMDLDPTQVDLLRDDPMATADLVAESRPIPDDTPLAAIAEAVASEPRVVKKTTVTSTLSPGEIDALRGQVVEIRDAATGAAMDSFYPPESEEYKREQRMKLMYPQLRRR